jgi:AcrR family transcriptional regulator
MEGTTGPAPGPVAPPDPPPEAPERRRRLVDLGVAAARAQPTGNALDHIRAEDVVARLNLTIGAFYHYWESQDDYRDDLLDALFAADRYVDTATIEVRRAATLDEAVRSATSWYWSVTVGHPENRMLFGLLAVDDPYLAPHLAAEAADLRSAWQTVVEALRWTLWGRATRALVTAATAPAGDDRDLATTAREALGSPS